MRSLRSNANTTQVSLSYKNPINGLRATKAKAVKRIDIFYSPSPLRFKFGKQGRRKHLKLKGARHFEGNFSLSKKGHFLKIKRALLCLLQNLRGARAPSAPWFLCLCW